MQGGLLDISWSTIFKVAVASFIFYLIFLVRDILVLFFFALIISVLLNPAIRFLTKFRLPRVLATIFIYVVIFGFLIWLILWTAPSFIGEVKDFLDENFSSYFGHIASILESFNFTQLEEMKGKSFSEVLNLSPEESVSSIAGFLMGAFESIGNILFILAMAMFLSLEERGMEKVLALFSPKKHEAYVLSLWTKTQTKVAGWFGSRLLTSIFVGFSTFITLYAFKFDEYALSMSFMAGILDFIPVLGPIIAGGIIFLFVALEDMTKGLFVLVAFFLIQQIEGNILSPILTKRFVGLPPVLVLLSLALGAKLLGILGAILIIPFAGIIFEFVRDFLKHKKEQDPVVL